MVKIFSTCWICSTSRLHLCCCRFHTILIKRMPSLNDPSQKTKNKKLHSPKNTPLKLWQFDWLLISPLWTWRNQEQVMRKPHTLSPAVVGSNDGCWFPPWHQQVWSKRWLHTFTYVLLTVNIPTVFGEEISTRCDSVTSVRVLVRWEMHFKARSHRKPRSPSEFSFCKSHSLLFPGLCFLSELIGRDSSIWKQLASRHCQH